MPILVKSPRQTPIEQQLSGLLHTGTQPHLAKLVSDRYRRVRLAAVRGLVSLDQTELITGAAHDSVREVRTAVAESLSRRRTRAPAPIDRAAVRALADPAWQVRNGAALALATAARRLAIEALAAASRDPHLDVRKAAVSSLSGWAGDPDVSVALKAALDDSDADVHAIGSACAPRPGVPTGNALVPLIAGRALQESNGADNPLAARSRRLPHGNRPDQRGAGGCPHISKSQSPRDELAARVNRRSRLSGIVWILDNPVVVW